MLEQGTLTTDIDIIMYNVMVTFFPYKETLLGEPLGISRMVPNVN